MTPLLCGQPLDALVGGPSPFAKVIALDYDDGPTSGLVRCREDAESYRFEQVAVDIDGRVDHESWDRGEELRIFTLAPLPSEEFDRIVARLAAIEPPVWPIWWPGARDHTPEQDRLLKEDLEPHRVKSKRPVLVVAMSGLLAPIAAA